MKSPVKEYLGLMRLINPALLHQPSAVAYVHRCSSSGELELLLEILRTAYSPLALLDIADKVSAQGEKVKRCRRGERQRAKGGGWRSLAYTRAGEGFPQQRLVMVGVAVVCVMRYLHTGPTQSKRSKEW